MFSWPECFSGLDGALFCRTLSSTNILDEASASKGWRLLVLPGDRAWMTDCGRPSLMGVSKTLELSFRWLSIAWGRSFAPGGSVLLLGLPMGVLGGSIKVFLTGVEGRPRSILLTLSLPPLANMLDLKLDILSNRSRERDANDGWSIDVARCLRSGAAAAAAAVADARWRGRPRLETITPTLLYCGSSRRDGQRLV